LTDSSAPTTLAFVKNAPNGEREFTFLRENGADIQLRSEDLPAEMLRSTRIFHYGSLSMTHEGIRSATQHAIAIARESGALLSFDPNLRPALWKTLADAKEQIAWGLAQCDILKISDDELQFMTGEVAESTGAAMLLQKYPNIRLMCVTSGVNGSTAYCNGCIVHVPAYTLGGTIDTTGAGDTFGGCMLHAVLNHGINSLDKDVLSSALRFANAAAYLVTTRRGALRVMPSMEEIRVVKKD